MIRKNTNYMQLRGRLASGTTYHHTSAGKNYYELQVKVERLSKTCDNISVIICGEIWKKCPQSIFGSARASAPIPGGIHTRCIFTRTGCHSRWWQNGSAMPTWKQQGGFTPMQIPQ